MVGGIAARDVTDTGADGLETQVARLEERGLQFEGVGDVLVVETSASNGDLGEPADLVSLQQALVGRR